MKRSAFLLLILTGCAVGPNYRPPKVNVPAQWNEATNTTATIVDWWKTFHDPELSSLIERAVGSKGPRPDPANDRNLPAGPDAEALAERPARRAPRILKIDQDRLREQSIVTPAGGTVALVEEIAKLPGAPSWLI
jgi:hypothetical protein